jgi:hypothetical protein
MALLPLEPRVKGYGGAKPDLQRKAAERGARARRITDWRNRQIANNPADVQTHIFALAALELGVATEQVREAVGGGGHNGITLRVTEQDRAALARFRDAKP